METLPTYSIEAIKELAQDLRSKLSEKRFAHTLSVAREILEIGQYYLPDAQSALTVAALLHDITKEWTDREQIDFCLSHDIPLSPDMLRSPAVLHALTAAVLIPEQYPDFAHPAILSAVARHTVGAPDMTVFDMLLFLSDFTEPTRRWEICKSVRRDFIEPLSGIAPEKREQHLVQATLAALEATVRSLIERRSPIVEDTVRTFNAFLLRAKG
jgi:predicted HD superfamily hydrolase involved in NAD metabolism